MNLREFIDWRKNCFVCQQELELYFHEPSSRVKRFALTEKDFSILVGYYNFSILLNENVIVNNGTSPDILAKFLKKDINIRMICPHNNHYLYQTNIMVAEDMTYTMPFVGEVLETEKFIMKQRSDYVCEVIFKSCFDRNSQTITLPHLDLNKTTLNKLQNKIKTYIVFS